MSEDQAHPHTLKIVANEHISPVTILALRNLGHEVAELPPRTKDRDLLNFAKQIDAIVITQDLDYSGLLARSKDISPSVVSLRLRIPQPARVTSMLAQILKDYRAMLETGAIFSVDDTGVPRIRMLPISD